MNIAEVTSPVPSFNGATFMNSTSDMQSFLHRLATIFLAPQAVLLGHVYLNGQFLIYGLRSSPPFLDMDNSTGVVTQYTWGDVVKGIEELSHNVTASLLTMPLGTMTTNCDFYYQDVVYQYSSVALWVPYGVSHFSLLSLYNLTIHRRPWVLLSFHLLLPSS